MPFTNVYLEHDETANDVLAAIQTESNNFTAARKLCNFIKGAAGGFRKLDMDIASASVKASGTLTLGEVTTGNTAVINGTTLTADTDFDVGADDDATADNLVAEINSNAAFTGICVAEKTTSEAAEVTTITCVADVSDSLNATSFILQDDAGSVGVWIDTDNSGTTIPAGANAADRAIEVTGVATDDTADDVASAVATAINGDSKFSAAAVGSVVTVTLAEGGAVTDAADSAGGEATGFTFAVTTQGADPIVTVTAARAGKMGNAITLAGTGAITASGARLTGGSDGTERNHDLGGDAADS